VHGNTPLHALLVDEALAKQPMLQWLLSFLFQLRFLFANWLAILGLVFDIVYRVIATYLIKKVGFTKAMLQTGAVMLIQWFAALARRTI